MRRYHARSEIRETTRYCLHTCLQLSFAIIINKEIVLIENIVYVKTQLVLDQYKSASKSQNDEMNTEIQRMRNQLKELKQASVQDAKEWELERSQLIDQLETVCDKIFVGYNL